MIDSEIDEADLVKYRIYQQQRHQAAKGGAFLLLTLTGLVIPIGWSTGVGYELIYTFVTAPAEAETSIDPNIVRALSSASVGAVAMLFLKPFTIYLRLLMTPPSPASDNTPQSESTTKFDAIAIGVLVVGIPATFYLIHTTISTGPLKTVATVSGSFFWLIAISCFTAARREFKRGQ